jgi:hypothetical protein
MALVLIAHLFLTRERLALRDTHRLLSGLVVLDMLRHKLPAKIISDRTKTWPPPYSKAIIDSLKQQSVITKIMDSPRLLHSAGESDKVELTMVAELNEKKSFRSA